MTTSSKLFGWSHDEIADRLAGALESRDAALREEQAVYGLDALNETEIHPLIGRALEHAGYTVLREQPYPTQWKRKRTANRMLPLPRDRERCDVVLTPKPGQMLRDSLTDARARALPRKRREATLFDDAVETDAVSTTPEEARDAVHPDDAYWLELKVAAQYSVESGVPGPNRAYGSQLTRFAAGDITKLSSDRTIVHGALALVLFTADETIASHDAGVLTERMMNRGLRISVPIRRTFRIQERIGNTCCSVVLVPLRPSPPVEDE